MAHKNFSQDLKIFLKNRGIRQKELADMLGVNHSTISNLANGRNPIGKTTAMKWSELTGIDPLWLMTQGEQGINPNDEAITQVAPAPKEDVIELPIINLDVRGGLAPNEQVDIEQYTTKTLPFSRSIACEGDVVVPVYGDSMAPRYPSGSHILIRPLPLWREWLEFGQSYVLELSDWRRTIKIVRKGSTAGTYRLDCYNSAYDSTEIPLSLIEHIWQVIMVVKRETI